MLNEHYPAQIVFLFTLVKSDRLLAYVEFRFVCCPHIAQLLPDSIGCRVDLMRRADKWKALPKLSHPQRFRAHAHV